MISCAQRPMCDTVMNTCIHCTYHGMKSYLYQLPVLSCSEILPLVVLSSRIKGYVSIRMYTNFHKKVYLTPYHVLYIMKSQDIRWYGDNAIRMLLTLDLDMGPC